MRRNDPILWVTGLVLALTWSISLVESLGWVDRPFPGFLVLENRVVASAGLSHWPAINGGEIYQHEIVAIDGAPLEDVADLHARVAAEPPGTPIRYRFRAGDHTFERTIPTRRFELVDFAMLFGSMLFCGGIVGITALLIRYLRRDRLATGSFALLAIASVWGASAPDLYGPYRLFRLHALTETLLFAGALHVALVFPHSSRLVTRWPRVTFPLYGSAALLALANQTGLHDPDAYVLTHNIATWAFGLGLVFLIGSHVRWYLWPPAFEARQVRAQAVVHALAEGEVADVVAVDIERVGPVVAALVAVGRPEQQQHRRPGRNGSSVVVEVPGQISGDVRAGGLEPQCLVDGPQQQ